MDAEGRKLLFWEAPLQRPPTLKWLPGLLVIAVIGLACGSASNQTDSSGQRDSSVESDAAVGGPVAGKLDDHCALVTPVVVSQASCSPGAGAGGVPGATEIPPVRYNASGDDDDCKYHVSFTTTPVVLNENVTFDVTATLLDPAANSAPATGADVQLESYLADLQFHLIPNTNPTTSESPASSGHYEITPVRFDTSGRWVVRFHLYENCLGAAADSPHGHIAFYLDVP